MTYYNPNLPIKVTTDVSNKGIGTFICHIMPDNVEKLIAHAAFTLSGAAQKYSQIEKKALAVIFAVKKFHCYIFGRRFIIWTDINHYSPFLAVKKVFQHIPQVDYKGGHSY